MQAFMSTRLRALLFLVLTGLGGHAFAQGAFPDKPVHIVVPYAAGGTSDLLARLIGQKLGERWGQPVVVENRPGAGTVIGASAVAQAAPNGHTLLLVNNTHVINPFLMAKLPYDALKDFTPVATLATSAYLLLVNPAVPAKTLSEFVALARSQPGKIYFGTHGIGGLTHLAAEMLQSSTGIKMELIQYKGAGPAMIAILGGEVGVYLDAPATTLASIQAGKLRPLAITGTTRLPALPQVPTVAQAGYPGFDVTIWYALLGPANLPPAVTQRLNADIATVLALPDVKQRLESLGVTPQTMSAPDLARYMLEEQEKYGRIVKTADIRIN